MRKRNEVTAGYTEVEFLSYFDSWFGQVLSDVFGFWIVDAQLDLDIFYRLHEIVRQESPSENKRKKDNGGGRD